MKKQHVQLSQTDRAYLEKLVGSGELKVKIYKRAIGLLELDRGKTLREVAETLNVTNITVGSWRDNYHRMGLACLQDQARSGRPIEIDGSQRAKVTALACSEPPAGYGRWTLRLLADKVVELGYSDHLSHTKVSEILKKTSCSRT
jgi:putative transposase